MKQKYTTQIVGNHHRRFFLKKSFFSCCGMTKLLIEVGGKGKPDKSVMRVSALFVKRNFGKHNNISRKNLRVFPRFRNFRLSATSALKNQRETHEKTEKHGSILCPNECVKRSTRIFHSAIKRTAN
jgi:hypothetical protein